LIFTLPLDSRFISLISHATLFLDTTSYFQVSSLIASSAECRLLPFFHDVEVSRYAAIDVALSMIFFRSCFQLSRFLLLRFSFFTAFRHAEYFRRHFRFFRIFISRRHFFIYHSYLFDFFAASATFFRR